MPSLFRFVFVLAVLGGIAFGIMLSLDIFVEPVPREMSERVPPTKLPR